MGLPGATRSIPGRGHGRDPGPRHEDRLAAFKGSEYLKTLSQELFKYSDPLNDLLNQGGLSLIGRSSRP